MVRAILQLLPATLTALIVLPWPNLPYAQATEPAPHPREAAGSEGKSIEYNRDIRPILAENCFACHGVDSAARKANLRLDNRDDAVGVGAIVPGKPSESLLIERIFAEDPREVMPPPKSHKKLTAAQKELLKKWIAEGADYQPHWSFIPPTRPTVPDFASDPVAKAWIRNPIDAFVYYKLKQNGLNPAPEADRRTLARRLALDLTGLPPEPAVVEAMVNDTSPNWYEKYVDQLLASPHWGEHRGRYWLDYARYADTHGIHFDNYREIWAYRDWVIDAFNRNMPFDQFTIEQLAGDLLPNPTLDQLIATGFNRCNITTNEGGAIKEEYLVLYARDRTETTAAVWMGLTAGCAVCHDHKYDPLTMRDFYSLSAFFNNTTQDAMDGNIPNTPPTIPVPLREDRPRYNQITKELSELRSQLEARKKTARPEFDKWAVTATSASVLSKNPVTGLRLHAPLTDNTSKTMLAVDGQVRSIAIGDGYVWGDGPRGAKALQIKQQGSQLTVPDAGDFDVKQSFTVAAWVKLTRANSNGAVVARMDPNNKHRGWDLWFEGNKPGTHIIHAFPENAIKVVSNNPLPTNQWVHVAIVYNGSAKAAGVRIFVNGTAQPTSTQNDSLSSTTRTEVPLTIGSRHNTERFVGNLIDDVRLYDRVLTEAELDQLVRSAAAADALAKPASERNPTEVSTAFDWWLMTYDQPTRELGLAIAKLQNEEAAIKARGTVAHIMNERPGEPGAYILFRGDYDKRRDPVKADTPRSMPPMAPDLPHNRLGLAKWLLQKDHPLTARVTVNRFWQEVFGTGLVRTSGDFGIAGELPSHPELLDWLAMEFREPTWRATENDPPGTAWDVKRFFKLIVTSATYRQSAATTPEKLERDRDNRLLSRGPRFRMDAEMIRDTALAASGLLVRKLGGPSVKPYQPDGVWEAVAMIGSNTRDYRRDTGEKLYRRSMYTFWKRSAPPAAMEVLNAPNRETCTVRRDRTNTPIAALLTLNDVQFVEAARVLAEKALKSASTDEARIQFIAERLLSRPFRPQELTIVKDSLLNLRASYRESPGEARKLVGFGESKADPSLHPVDLAAWTMLCNQLMNLDEVLNK
jgi:mono/diheme cytochrome c family protein